MADIDIAEQICLAVDEIIKKRLEDIKYDTTIVGTIVDNTDAKLYRYICSNGSSNFIAYSKDTTYKIGDSVQITIPNNDYDQQKIIIGKYVAKENDTPYVFIQPFDTMIDVSSNLINNNKETIYGALLANEDADNNYNASTKLFNKEKHLWTTTFDIPQAGFNRLGLQGQFRSWISSFKPILGNYGYRLEVYSENAEIVGSDRVSIKDWIKLYGKVLNGEDNLNEAGILDNTPDSWYNNVKPKEEYIIEFKEKEKRVELVQQMLYANAQLATLLLDSTDMYGNPYNFQNYFQQEIVFDISEVEPIIGMTLFFYEISNSFLTEDNEPMIYKDAIGNKLPPNLFTKDPYICLGYDLASFDKEEAILYTMNSKGYRFEGNPDTEENKALNKKTIRLRWLHEFENGDIHVINDDTKIGDFEVRWYRFKLGSPSADEYSGVYWEHVPNDKSSVFDFSFVPKYNLESEQIKAIILYQGNIIRSNILTFNNEKEVANSATAELLAGLSIWCQDNSYGNYYLYGQNNDLLKPDEANKIRSLEARFADRSTITSGADVDKNATILTEAQKIVWEFPLNNSMIVVQGFNYDFKRDLKQNYPDKILDKPENLWYNIIEQEGLNHIYKLPNYYDENVLIKVDGNVIKIIRTSTEEGVPIEAHQEYRIQKTYASTKINNTVRCYIDKNGFTYSASKDLSFGIMGTNGTDATLVIDFNNNITALTADAEESVKVSARLYDNNHNEVDFYNNDLKLECDWSWAYYHEFSEEQEVEIYNKALNDKEFLKSLFGDQEIDINNLSDAQKRKIHAEAMGRAGSVKIEPHNDNEPVNVCYLSHDTDLPMNENGLFLILQATVKGYGNYDLTAYKAIPIRKVRNYRHIIGPSEVIYNSAGYIDYYKGPYEIYHAETVDEYDMVPSGIEIVKKDNATWQIFDPYWDEEKPNKYIGNIPETNILQPASMYFEGVEPYGSICKIENQIVWIQPLVIMQNRYPSATINKWDGKSIEINENEGYILAPAIAAGKKHGDNSFSGVMIGDWSGPGANIGGTADEITKQTGVYGFNHGAMAYALMEDGTAFIGKDGRGRIYFDGNDAKIYSATYHDPIGAGMMIDLGGDDESPFIDIKAPGSSILLKAEEGASEIIFEGSGGEIVISSGDSYPLTIGQNFWVEWNGDLHANDAYLVDAYLDNAYLKNAYMSGIVVANEGVIGGWKITDNILQGGTTTFKDFSSLKEGEEAYSWQASQPEIYLDAPHAAICGGNLKPSLASLDSRHVMNLWGYLQVCDSDGNPINGNNYFGYIQTGMPGVDGDGIGLSMQGTGAIKLTTSNIGLNYLPGGSYISLHNTGITMEAGTSSDRKTMAIYGGDIWIGAQEVSETVFYGKSFEINGIPPEQQKGIYARFA